MKKYTLELRKDVVGIDLNDPGYTVYFPRVGELQIVTDIGTFSGPVDDAVKALKTAGWKGEIRYE